MAPKKKLSFSAKWLVLFSLLAVSAHGASLDCSQFSGTGDAENLHGNGTTAVQLSRSLNVVLKSIVGYSAFKNTLVDLANACTIPESVEPFLALYVTNQAHKIVVSSSAIAGCTP